MVHIPILRKGVPYRSLDTIRTPHYRTREDFVEISQANVGLIRRDLLDQRTPREALAAFSTPELIVISRRAADIFLNDALPLGAASQTPDEYVRQLAATTGMPHALARRNMKKIHAALSEMEKVILGLTRGVPFEVLDRGFGDGLSFFPRTDSMGIVLPSNSPGVHSLWTPAFALKIPLVLKPGSAEPWTPYRIIQALIRAGAPPAAFSYYPADHAGGGEILRQCGRGMVFGDVSSTKIWANDPRVEVHGPGYSKIVIGEDCADDWEKYLDPMVESIAANSGRSCVNASGVWTARHASKIAEALAERLAKIVPRAEDDPEAQLAPFADMNVAKRMSGMIDAEMAATPGARDVSAALRGPERFVTWERCGYLLPTIVECDVEHPLANREYLFPFASVVEISQDKLPDAMGPSLAVMALTNDPKFRKRLLSSPLVGRLNFGPIPTMQITWDQPHEGNLFDHLYARRAFQAA
ncbi:MAG TPA: aldehyde dehydrogenase family protein [Bryobacteraceae bacterium]|nr:aldehyde dehydrogenase family protein [Bryobacteraceae bacterium]